MRYERKKDMPLPPPEASDFSTRETAGYLRVSEKTVRRWTKTGKLSPYCTAGGYRYPREDVQNLVTDDD